MLNEKIIVVDKCGYHGLYGVELDEIQLQNKLLYFSKKLKLKLF